MWEVCFTVSAHVCVCLYDWAGVPSVFIFLSASEAPTHTKPSIKWTPADNCSLLQHGLSGERCDAVLSLLYSTVFCLRTISASRRGRETMAHCFIFSNIPSLILTHKCTLSMCICLYIWICVCSIWVHEHLSALRTITMWLPLAILHSFCVYKCVWM